MTAPEMKAIPLSTANPFPGLRPFREDEADLFFGQEDHVEDLIDRVGRKRFVAVLGQSGCGKSSLMRAGLMPQLRRGMLANGQPRWVIIETQPGENPIGRLIEQMTLAFPNVGVAEEMKRDSRALARIASKAGLPERQKVLIFVDQFEELFRYRRQNVSAERHDQADYFVQLLLETVDDPDSPIYVMLAMRTEFLGDCALFFDLAEKVNDGTFLLPRMTRDQTEQVIIGPVKQRGAAINCQLVHQLLNDGEGQEDGLPLLQHALRRIWEHWVERAEPLSEIGVEDYALELTEAEQKAWPSLLQAHLNVHLNSIYESLGKPREDVARDLFRLLSERDGKGRDTRRPLAYEDILAAFAPEQQREVAPVIEAFRDAQRGRTFLVPGQGKALPGAMVDISHECLLRRWDRLRKWMGWEDESRRLFELLADTADGVGWRGATVSDSVAPLEGFQLRMLQEWRERVRPTPGWARRYCGADDVSLGRRRREFAAAIEYLDWSAERKALADEERKQAVINAEKQEVELRRVAAENRAAAAELDLVRRQQRAKVLRAFALGVGLVLAYIAFEQFRQRQVADELRLKAEVAEQRANNERNLAKQAEAKAKASEEDAKFARSYAELKEALAVQAQQDLARVNVLLAADKKKLGDNAILLGRSEAAAREQTEEAKLARAKAEAMSRQLEAMNRQLGDKNRELEATNAKLERSIQNEEFQKAGNRTQLDLQAATADPDAERRVKRAYPLLDSYREKAKARPEISQETRDVFVNGLEAISQALQGSQVGAVKSLGAGVTAAAFDQKAVMGLLPVAGLSMIGQGPPQPLPIRHLGHVLFEPGRQVSAFDIAAGGRYIALGTQGGRIAVFEHSGSGPYRRIMSKRPRWNAASLVRFGRDGQLMVTSAEKGGWTLFDLASKKETAQDEKNGHRLAQAAVSGNGRWLAYTTDKQGVIVQPFAARGAQRGEARVLVPESVATAVSHPIDISDDGWVITTSAQQALEVHARADEHTHVLRGAAGSAPVSAVALSPGEEWLAVADAKGAIALYDWKRVKAPGARDLPEPLVRLRPGPGRESRVLRLTWQGQTLAALDEGGSMNVWKPFARERIDLLANVQDKLKKPMLDLDDLAAILREIARVFALNQSALVRR